MTNLVVVTFSVFATARLRRLVNHHAAKKTKHPKQNEKAIEVVIDKNPRMYLEKLFFAKITL
jgi:hypothetical protein